MIKLIKSSKVGVEKFSVKRLLHERLTCTDPARSIRSTHASALTYTEREWCPREISLLGLVCKKQKDELIPASLRVTFDQGIDMQTRINEQYLIDVMIGNWECRSCGLQRNFCKKPGKSACGNSDITCNWEYKEVRINSEYWGVSCGLDALITNGSNKLRLVEVKTMAISMWEPLKTALAEHRQRTQMYMQLISESSLAEKIETSVATVLYILKGFGKKDSDPAKWGIRGDYFSPYKEYAINRKEWVLDYLLNRARLLMRFRKGEVGMPGGVCDNSFCKRAKYCPVVKECFSGQYPATHTWVDVSGPRHPGKLLGD